MKQTEQIVTTYEYDDRDNVTRVTTTTFDDPVINSGSTNAITPAFERRN